MFNQPEAARLYPEYQVPDNGHTKPEEAKLENGELIKGSLAENINISHRYGGYKGKYVAFGSVGYFH
jgi:hypothetical protein